MKSHVNKEDIFLNYSSLKRYNLINFTTTRNGGVSKGNYESMNPCLFSNDNIEDALQNRSLLAQNVGVKADKLFIPYQTHEDKIRIIDEAFLALPDNEKTVQLYGIDALITQEKNICIGITTADCVPVLIYDPTNHVLASIHAGWKGTVLRIAAKTVIAMKQRFQSNPSDLIVAIGPSISQAMFEVGDEVGTAFGKAGFNLDRISYRHKDTGKLHIDLWEANKEQLLELGVKRENIEVAEICTFRNENYFSARRQTINSGRMVTGGVLK